MNTGNKLNPLSDDSVISESYIIVRINTVNNKIFLINADGKPRKPISMKLDEIKQEIKDQKIHVSSVSCSFYSLQGDDEIKESWREIRDIRWKIIKPLVSEEKDLDMFLEYTKGTPIVSKRLKETGVSRPSIYKFIYMYLQGGSRKNALLPDLHKVGKGHNGKSKVGALRRDKATGKTVTDNDKDNIKSALKGHFYDKKKPNLKDTYIYMCDKYYSDEILNEDGIYIKEHWDDNRKPSKNQFKYWAKYFIDPIKASKKRLGESKHDKDNRPINSSSDFDVRGPTERFQIDATVGDIYLVSEFDRTRKTIIGRPVIYIVTDVYSRAIVGAYSGQLEHPFCFI